MYEIYINIHTYCTPIYILSLVLEQNIFLHIVNMGIDKRATLPPLPPVHVTTRATLSVAAYARHIYFQLESAVRFEPYKVT